MIPKFENLAAYIAWCADGAANGTGAPRTHFDLHVVQDHVGPEVQHEITVLEVYPHGFEYMKQRFGLKDETGMALLNAEQLEGHKQFLRNDARAKQAIEREVAERASQGGVALARIPDSKGGVA